MARAQRTKSNDVTKLKASRSRMYRHRELRSLEAARQILSELVQPFDDIAEQRFTELDERIAQDLLWGCTGIGGIVKDFGLSWPDALNALWRILYAYDDGTVEYRSRHDGELVRRPVARTARTA